MAPQRGQQLAARERELVEGGTAACGHACPEAKVRRREPAYAVDVRCRDDERAAGREHATRLGQDRVGSRGVVLGDAERDVRGGRAVAQRQRRQLGRRQRCLGRLPRGGHRVDAPVHTHGAPAAFTEQDDVLSEPAAGFEDEAVRGQRPRHQRCQRRAARDRQQLVERLPAPVVVPEFLRRRHGVIGEHAQSLRATARKPVVKLDRNAERRTEPSRSAAPSTAPSGTTTAASAQRSGRAGACAAA